jgi:hypothetical protein
LDVVESGYGATLVVLRVMGCFGIARLDPAYVMRFVKAERTGWVREGGSLTTGNHYSVVPA